MTLLVVVPNPNGVAGLWIEGHVVRTGSMGDPALDHEVTADRVWVDPQIVGSLVAHAVIVPERSSQDSERGRESAGERARTVLESAPRAQRSSGGGPRWGGRGSRQLPVQLPKPDREGVGSQRTAAAERVGDSRLPALRGPKPQMPHRPCASAVARSRWSSSRVRVPSRTTTTTSAISVPISRRISGSRTGRDWQLVRSATTHSEPCCDEPPENGHRMVTGHTDGHDLGPRSRRPHPR